MTNQIILKEQLKISGPGVDFVSCRFILFFKNKRIFIQSVKKYNINIKTYMQVVLLHYTSISSKTDKISKFKYIRYMVL
jgi:hypothetical protein